MINSNTPFDPNAPVIFTDIVGVLRPKIVEIRERGRAGGIGYLNTNTFIDLLAQYGFRSSPFQYNDECIASFFLDIEPFVYQCYLGSGGEFTLVLKYRSSIDGQPFCSEYRYNPHREYPHNYMLEGISLMLIGEIGKIMDPIFYDADINILLQHRLIPITKNETECIRK